MIKVCFCKISETEEQPPASKDQQHRIGSGSAGDIRVILELRFPYVLPAFPPYLLAGFTSKASKQPPAIASNHSKQLPSNFTRP